MILHRDADRLLILYAGHHDDAYKWAESHRIDENSVTHALQVVTLVESVLEQETVPPTPVQIEQKLESEQAQDDSLLDFSVYSAEYLLQLGVPEDWISKVQSINDEKSFDRVCKNLPEEAWERQKHWGWPLTELRL